MFCEKCGSQIAAGSNNCPNCGAAVIGMEPSAAEKSQSQPQPRTYQSQPQPPSYQPQPQPQPYQPPYGASNQYNANYQSAAPSDPRREPLSVLGYIGTTLLFGIPLVGFIAAIVWAVSSTTNINRKNYAISFLILMVVFGVLSLIFSAAIFALLGSIMNEIDYGTYSTY